MICNVFYDGAVDMFKFMSVRYSMAHEVDQSKYSIDEVKSWERKMVEQRLRVNPHALIRACLSVVRSDYNILSFRSA